MAEQTYNPFSGFSKGNKSKISETKLQPVDWSKKELPAANKWRILDLSGVSKAGSKKSDAPAAAPAHQLSEEEAEEWRASHDITLSEGTTPPITQFAQLTNIPQYLQQKLLVQGFKEPTPIQAQAWPILMSGRDLVGVAKTGSGKTLAFVVPALAHMAIQPPLKPGEGPICVILAPTRELAQQIEAETVKVLPSNIRCGCIYGGAPKGPQLGMLRQGVHILVATPGRLIDFLEIKRVNLFRVTYLVLDEADRMLDMGFEPQVRAICGQIRPDRQTLMFSATWPREIQNLAATFQKNWVRINVGSAELLANKDVSQTFVLTTESGKFDELKKLLEARRNQRNLIFCKTKKTADYLEFQLKRIGVDAMAIHGDKEQKQREFIIDRFRRDKRLCLVATDVAARGLDIKELETVINYDFPMQIDDYVHRIGRTGRAGAKGEAITLLTKREDQLTPANVRQLVGIAERADQEVPAWLREWSAAGSGYAVVAKRNRNATGAFSGRNAPQMRMPGSSFDPSGSNYFGLGGNRDGSKAFGVSSPNSIQNQSFDYSDSDEDNKPASKKARK
eukprot:gene5141-3692_t